MVLKLIILIDNPIKSKHYQRRKEKKMIVVKDMFWTTNDKISKKKKKRNTEDKGSFHLRAPLTNRTLYLSFFIHYTFYSNHRSILSYEKDEETIVRVKSVRSRSIQSIKYILSFRRKREKEGRKEKKKKFFNVLRNVYESTRVAQCVFFVSQRYFDKYRRTQKNFRCSFVRSFCDPHPFRILFTVFTFHSFYLCFVPLIPKESYPSICVCFLNSQRFCYLYKSFLDFFFSHVSVSRETRSTCSGCHAGWPPSLPGAICFSLSRRQGRL